jgi:ABC-2 type transport system ATP-binding protein
MNDVSALEAVLISKRFSGRAALADVHVAVRRGEVHGLIGPNGAGKTTLLRILLGLVRRDAGTMNMLGRAWNGAGNRLPDSVAGFVETPTFYPYLSARVNLTLLTGLDLQRRLQPRAGSSVVGQALDAVGLASSADAAVATFSAGMRQRLGIAAASLRRPSLLLLDEPTSALDPAGARDVRAQLLELAAAGAGILFASHDLVEVESICSAVTIIDRGRIAFTGSIADLRPRMPSETCVMRTSDDRAALDLAGGRAGLRATVAPEGGLDLEADADTLDAFVIALGGHRIAIRSLERRPPSLESLFLRLTGDGETT